MLTPYQRSNKLSLTKISEAYLHLTNRCVGGCKHCYASATPRTGQVELNTVHWLGILNELKALGAEGVVFLGGDPFLREDWPELVDYALRELRLGVRIFYNGLISTVRAEQLAVLAGEGKLFLLASLEGPDAASNDYIRGRGNFDRTVTGIRNLIQTGIAPVINTVVTNQNMELLPRMAAWLRELGVKRQHLLLPVNRGYLRREKELLPDPERLTEKLLNLFDTAREVGLFVDNFAAWKVRLQGNYDLCNAGYDLLTIGPDGGVYGCPMTVNDSRFCAGNLISGDLRDIWWDSPRLQILRDNSSSRDNFCRTCRFSSACGGDCMMYGYYQSDGDTGQPGLNERNPYCGTLQGVFNYLTGLEGVIQAGGDSLQAFQCC